MGNIDSSSKSPSSNYRRSSTSKESEPTSKLMYNRTNDLTNRNNNKEYSTTSQNEFIKQNKSKKITDIIGVKLKRSGILKNIDSLKIVQIASRITNKVLNKNLDNDVINLISSTVVPNTREKNPNFNLNKDIFTNLNSSFNSMIFSEKFCETKANEFRYRGNDKIYFNELIKKSKSIGRYLNNPESKSRDELNNLFASKNNEIDNLIKEKIEKLIIENESSVKLNLNCSESSSQNKDIISGVSSKLSSDNNQEMPLKNYNAPVTVRNNTSNSKGNKDNESSYYDYHNNNKNNINQNESSNNVNEKEKDSRYNANNKTKVLKLDLSKANLNRTKTVSNLNTTSRSKSPNGGKYDLMKNYNKSRVSGFLHNSNRENSNNNSKHENSYWNSPKTSEIKNDKNVKELHLKIKINQHNRSPDAKIRDASNSRSNIRSKKANEEYIIIDKPARDNSNKRNIRFDTEYVKHKHADLHLDATADKEINSERHLNKNRLNNNNTDQLQNKQYSKSPMKASKYTPLKSKNNNYNSNNQSKMYLNTEVIEYKPDKFNPDVRAIKTDRSDSSIGKIKQNIYSDRNIGNYDFRTNSKDISINYGLTERTLNNYSNPPQDNKFIHSRMPETTVKSNTLAIFYK